MIHYLRRTILLAFTLMMGALSAQAQTSVLAGWTFESTNTSDRVFADQGNINNVGIQIISLKNINFTTYVLGSGGTGTSAKNANGWQEAVGIDKYWQVKVNTIGFESLSISSKQQGSNTGPKDFRIDYSLDGEVWAALPGGSISVSSLNFNSGTVTSLPIPAAASNQETVFLRWIKSTNVSINGGTVASTGTNRIDDIFIEGIAIGEALEPAATPIINPNGGTFEVAQTVSLSSTTTGASIYYTLDASAPNLSSTLYTSPILIEASAVVSAISIAEGFAPSDVASAEFTINLLTVPSSGIPYTQSFADFNNLSNPVTKFGANNEWDLKSSGNVNNYNGLFDSGTAGGFRGGNVLGYQHTGSSGVLTATLTLENTTGKTINFLEISYLGRVGRNDQARTPNWTVVVNEITYPQLAYSTAGGEDLKVKAIISDLNILPGALVTITWSSDRGLNTTGSSRQIGIADLSVVAKNAEDLIIPGLTANPSSLDFGGVSLADASPVLSYELTAENLESGVTITAPEKYSVSKNGDTFTPSIEFTLAELSIAKTVFVRLDNSQVGVFNASISHQTAGSSTVSVSVTGSVFDPFNISENFNNTCPALPAGWQAISVDGIQAWACTTFGRAGTTPTASAPFGLQINGFSGGAVLNQDWLISAPYDLTGFNIPLMTFWSRVAFQGPRLKLLISTNYTSGDPNASTWTELSDRFASGDVWSFSGQVDLSEYSGQTVRVAFVYNSSPETGAARWTLDDFSLFSSEVPAQPFFSNSIGNVDYWHFGVVPVGGNSTTVRTFNFNLSNPVADLSITGGEGFEFSKDGLTFSASLTYSVAELTEQKSVQVRFTPTSEGAFASPIRFESGEINVNRGYLTGATINKDQTFDVVNWNIEWFGSNDPGEGPSDVDLQLQNVKTIIEDLDADVYAFQEITSLAKFKELVASLPAYGMAVSPAVSAPGEFAEEAQKLTYLFKLATVDTLRTKVLLKGVKPDMLVNYPSRPDRFWASGRLPFLMDIKTNINGVQQNITLINVHTRSNGGGESAVNPRYAMRRYDVNVLKDSLDAYYSDKQLILLGDFNDDLDETVADQAAATVNTSETSFINYINDPENYVPITISLSNAGLRTFPSFEDVIDHQIISNDLRENWIVNSERIVAPYDLIPNYNNTTSDHLAVETRFIFFCDLEQPTLITSQTEVCAGSNSVEIQLIGGRFDSVLAWETSIDNGTTWTLLDQCEGLTSIIIENLIVATLVRAVIDSEICDPIATESVAIAIKTLPIPVIGFQSSRLFTIEGPYTYDWFKNGILIATTSVNDTRIQGAGIYTVQITDAEGCTATSEEFSFPTNGNSSKVRVFPNPVSELVYIELRKVEGLQNVELRTSNGLFIQSVITESGIVQFDVSNLAKGIYLIYIIDQAGITSVERLQVK
ncbi:chitobiase/beta-hexosaminidase C-terminal domain-containing protein [Aquiflexum sp. TKW24L]|uniref:chitobiase/beta-hexosaminidase C-terminal domain-containing protein n=1 Tax=Aquiflexum sp. TKW24L TaxID=2942212 RepID=UPI0020BE5A80|nr:chitobiase/beta-hexosaminidase C-terminal domain-containing protein [Aquiflexum sp. TKW24L]MCL6261050.1 chitobiase/beta-hexosaminidase C-terminal domain-containing protein [Aquiflexum sp. TKW24L]